MKSLLNITEVIRKWKAYLKKSSKSNKRMKSLLKIAKVIRKCKSLLKIANIIRQWKA